MRPMFNDKTRIDQRPFFTFQNFAKCWRNFGKTFDRSFRKSENKGQRLLYNPDSQSKYMRTVATLPCLFFRTYILRMK
jgi:hypothetical protein